jgi:predicted DCC family thiol-disulfide oxidoreductase YuxK/uncharacterized membrane protein YphA (DoxX/SURF4 family)
MLFLKHLKKSFSFDLRSLAFYRFFLGLIVLADVIYRLEDLTNFYTDVGLVPRSIFITEMAMPWSFSLHLANGSYWFAVLMFTLHLILGLMLLFGYKTRWAILGAFIMAISVHNRNWLINNGGDDVLRAILFLSIFLPLNKRFSIDSALSKERSTSDLYFSTWVLAFFLQVFLIYFVSYILKDSDIWRKDYTAFFFSSRLDIFATPFGIWLRQFPSLGKVITFLSIYLEWLGPLLLSFAFVFKKSWWKVRFSLVVLFILFHFGIFLTMNIGLFTFICMVMWLLFLPGDLWDLFQLKSIQKQDDKLVIFYDSECDFCFKIAKIIREFFLLSTVQILPAQSNNVVFKEMKKMNSWVVRNEAGKFFYQFEGFLEVLKHSTVGRFLYPLFSMKLIKKIGTNIYCLVSNNRNIFARISQYFPYTESKKEIRPLRWISEVLGAFIFLTLLMWNLTTIKKLNISAPFFQNVTRWLHLYQEWNMFAPFPKMDNVWVEIPATLNDESEIELLSGSSDIYSIKEDSFYKGIPNEHWRKFFLNLSDRSDYARYYGGFLCRQWNDRKIQSIQGKQLKKFEIIVYSQQNLPNGEKGGISRKLSWKHWCFDKDYQTDNSKKP